MAYIDIDMHRALADAGYAPLDEYVQRQRERRRLVFYNVYQGNGETSIGAPHDTRAEVDFHAKWPPASMPVVLRLVVRPK